MGTKCTQIDVSKHKEKEGDWLRNEVKNIKLCPSLLPLDTYGLNKSCLDAATICLHSFLSPAFSLKLLASSSQRLSICCLPILSMFFLFALSLPSLKPVWPCNSFLLSVFQRGQSIIMLYYIIHKMCERHSKHI